MRTYFAETIEKWYAVYGRSLPWRDTHDAYRIWVSEIILQQTRVAQGYEYFIRFIERFPDVRSLAEAAEDDVLRLWQGLGYYSRARNMHKAAKQVMQSGGEFPKTYDALRSLAGIGDYTASAIMSFAYNEPYAVLDGNVYRILSRVHGIAAPIDTTAGQKLFKSLADEMLDVRQPGLYNQAIMDFGALQCVPKGCDCTICPLADICKARNERKVEELPVKAHKIAVKERHLFYIYVRDGKGNTLLHKRKEGDIWAGLYEFPVIENEWNEEPWLQSLMNHNVRLTQKCKGIKHQLTHQSILADFYELIVDVDLNDWLRNNSTCIANTSFICINECDIEAYGMPRLLHRFLSQYE